ncbi:bifunctional DNA primase/polymerase [Actinopolyspora mortivallis]|uniref:DNA primase/polymerase bifunctional N-terminal domain-containing protein n=1 Tax=Actinopolyspora mortivallis TaxID=33906 RepID=A0A2T0GTF8_ACTMO|nr:bifunctional DNA primase/polymerase [Actinopolyspora mortivallis]PRW62408.1 hypothetical protein CEP50_15770 [Actinopolyspora mortivallis]
MDLAAEGWHSAFRIELRVQVLELVSRGWPVFPGTYPVPGGWSASDSAPEEVLSEGPIPVWEDWADRAGNTDGIAAWWSKHPHSVLLATGPEIEAIEVEADLGRRAARALRGRGRPVPMAATPHGRWYFLTRGGQRLHEELGEAGLVLHSGGSWVPLPPSTFPQGVLHWRVKPQVCDWWLPEPEHVQEALLTGLHDPAERASDHARPLAVFA